MGLNALRSRPLLFGRFRFDYVKVSLHAEVHHLLDADDGALFGSVQFFDALLEQLISRLSDGRCLSRKE